jgi:hypothetical protein
MYNGNGGELNLWRNEKDNRTDGNHAAFEEEENVVPGPISRNWSIQQLTMSLSPISTFFSLPLLPQNQCPR